MHRRNHQLGVRRALAANDVAERPLDVIRPDYVAVFRLDIAETEVEDVVGAGAACDAGCLGRGRVVAPGEGHRQGEGRTVGHAVEEERRVVRENASREAVLSYVEGVLPHVGKRIETPVHLDELTGAHGFCELASWNSGVRHLSAGDVAVAVRGYVQQSVRLFSSHMRTNALNII